MTIYTNARSFIMLTYTLYKIYYIITLGLLLRHCCGGFIITAVGPTYPGTGCWLASPMVPLSRCPRLGWRTLYMEDNVLPALDRWGPTAVMISTAEKCLYSSPEVIISHILHSV